MGWGGGNLIIRVFSPFHHIFFSEWYNVILIRNIEGFFSAEKMADLKKENVFGNT
jgi:hypothetical protein